MSALTQLVERAYAAGASDLHLESGLPPAFRVNGRLQVQSTPLSAQAVQAMAREVAGAQWSEFLAHRSLDLSKRLAGVRCRINVLQSRRGLGLAVRLLTAFTATIESLNLHPSIAELAAVKHGLVLVSGPTGSGKSSTIAALVQEINRSQPLHVLTLEQPVEHWLKPNRSFIRQREVGHDTPSFEQGLTDALREDPDVIVVGEMRRPETMRLTIDAAETGHLVLTTVHSSSCAEAIARVVSAFPAEAQDGVQAQLADALAAVVCQRLIWREDLGIRVPELEVLRVNQAARASIRKGALAQIATVLETGGDDGCWTRERYARWLAGRRTFHKPSRKAPGGGDEEPTGPSLPPLQPARSRRPAAPAAPTATGGSPAADGVFVLDDAGADTASILSELLGK
jgi:twitching motility protein PilT